jgi:hypothetical protein
MANIIAKGGVIDYRQYREDVWRAGEKRLVAKAAASGGGENGARL